MAQPADRRVDPGFSHLVSHTITPGPTGYRRVTAQQGAFRYDGRELVPLRALVAPAGSVLWRRVTRLLCAGRLRALARRGLSASNKGEYVFLSTRRL